MHAGRSMTIIEIMKYFRNMESWCAENNIVCSGSINDWVRDITITDPIDDVAFKLKYGNCISRARYE